MMIYMSVFSLATSAWDDWLLDQYIELNRNISFCFLIHQFTLREEPIDDQIVDFWSTSVFLFVHWCGKKKQKLALLSLRFISFSHLMLSSICPFSSGHTVVVEDVLSVHPSVQSSLSAPATPTICFHISRSPLIKFTEADSRIEKKKKKNHHTEL